MASKPDLRQPPDKAGLPALKPPDKKVACPAGPLPLFPAAARSAVAGPLPATDDLSSFPRTPW